MIGTVYESPKTVKRQSNSIKWPLLYKSSHVYTKSTEYTKPRKRRYLARPPSRAWALATAVRARGQGWLYVSTWTSMRLAPVRCRVLLHSLLYLLMMPAARLVCQRPSSNFPYFRTPLAKFLLSRPNSAEYGNSKTTPLLNSAKCTRPLFQGRTGCGGRPSGRHDIVTCQHLVI